MKKRYRIPEPKDNTLSIKFAKVRGDSAECLVYTFGEGCEKADSSLLMCCFDMRRTYISLTGEIERENSLVDELIERGYDITTLKFSIKKLKESTE